MSVLSVNPTTTGLIGVTPNVIQINTSNTLAEVQAIGYLNASQKIYGNIYSDQQMALVYTLDTGPSWLRISIIGMNISLLPIAAASAVTSVGIVGSDFTITNSPITSVGNIGLVLNTVPLAKGGTGSVLTASNGGIVWSNATQLQILSGTPTAGQVLVSGANATPTWSSTTFPVAVGINQLLYGSAANVISGLPTANNGTLVTSNTGVPSILSGPGTTGNVLQSNINSAPSFSTAIYPVSSTANQILYSSADNVITGLVSANNSVLITSGGGVPSLGATLPNAVQINITALGVQGQALNMGAHQINNMADPTTTQDAATKNYVDMVAAGLNPAQPVVAATTGSDIGGTYNNGASGIGATLTNAGTQTAFVLDGQSLSAGNRVLIKNETAAADNGIYVVTVVGSGSTNWVLTRATNYDTPAEIAATGIIPVINGALNANTAWLCTSTVTAIGTDAITFTQFGVTYPVSLANGGTGSVLSATSGGVFYSTASGGAITAAGGAGSLFVSNGTSAPSFSTNVSAAISFSNTISAANYISLSSVNTLTATPINLTSTSNYQQYFTGASAQTVKMPLNSTCAVGQEWYLINLVSTALTVELSNTSSLTIIPPFSSCKISCIINTGGDSSDNWAIGPMTIVNTGIIAPQSGGTGINNGSSTITIGGNVTFSGASTFTGTLTGNTNVTFPTSGTLSTTTGTVTSVTGTTNQINVATGTSTPVLSLSSTIVLPGTLSTAQTVTLSGLTASTMLALDPSNNIASISSVNNAVLSTNGSGIPSFSTTLPSGIILVAPVLGTPASGNLVNCTGYPAGGLTGIVALINGGTSAALSAISGGVFYSTASAAAITSAGTNGQIFISSGTGTPRFSDTLPNVVTFQQNPTAPNYLTSSSTQSSTAGPINLTSTSNYQQYFTGASAQTVKMPPNSSCQPGEEWYLINTVSTALTVTLNGGALLTTIPAFSSCKISCNNVIGSDAISKWTLDAIINTTSGVIAPQSGGTGINNGSSTITIGGNVAFAGAFTFTGNITANTNVTFPTSGTLSTTSGTVTSIGISSSTGLTIGSSPVTASGTITVDMPASVTGNNMLFNGDMIVWQRGAGGSASFAVPASTVQYTADRWQVRTGTALSTVSQAAGATSGSYLLKFQRNSGQTSGSAEVAQTLTRDMCIGAAGNKVTLSFKAKCGANYSATSNLLTVTVFSGTGTTDVGIFTGFTGQATAVTSNVTLSTTLTSYSITTSSTLGSTITQLAAYFVTNFTGTGGADDSFSITDLQLEQAPQATNYQRKAFVEELERCQFFYQKSFIYGTAPVQNAGIITGEVLFVSGAVGASTLNSDAFYFQNPMRITPTIVGYNPAAANAQVRNESAGADCSATSIYAAGGYNFRIGATGSVGTVVGNACGLHYTADAELT